jgi:hypothetical protein
VILALLDARDLSLRKSRGFGELGLHDAELLSKRLKIQLDDLLLDPSCVGVSRRTCLSRGKACLLSLS